MQWCPLAPFLGPLVDRQTHTHTQTDREGAVSRPPSLAPITQPIPTHITIVALVAPPSFLFLLFVHGLYLCAIRMVNSGDLSLEKILPPQVVFESLEGTEGTGSPLHR